MINKIAIAVSLALALLVSILAWAALHYYGKSVVASGTISQLQSDNTLQSTTIAGQALDFQRINSTASLASQYNTKITGESQEREIEYRTILKKEPTCSLLIPADIAGRLYDYANSLRAGAMQPTASDANGTAAGASATERMTYCQAVLWIDPLLTVIDRANNDRASVRQIEAERQK